MVSSFDGFATRKLIIALLFHVYEYLIVYIYNFSSSGKSTAFIALAPEDKINYLVFTPKELGRGENITEHDETFTT